MTLAPKTRLGEFEIRFHLASGGTDHVYIVWDSVLKREVAIKVLPDSVAQDKERVSSIS